MLMQLRRLTECVKILRHNMAGVVAIEFAVVLPLLLLLTYGGYEGWRLVLAGQRLDHVAYSLSDLASRLTPGTTEGDITNMLSGGLFVGKPFKIEEDGRVILSAIDSKPGRKILWQRCIGNGNLNSSLGAEGDNANVDSINRMPTSKDGIIYITEVNMLYTPPLVGFIYGQMTLRRVALTPGRVTNPSSIDVGGPVSNCADTSG
jgi:TadE-like protein